MNLRKEVLGLVCLFLLISAGRMIHTRLLIGPDGTWRDPLPGETCLPPLPDAAPPTPPKPPAGPFAVNTTTADTLCFLPGIGPVMAQRIIDERAIAPFTDLQDLQRVKGIGPRMAEKLTGKLVFD
jgi:predicted flap endonuclease-1-like 5' DNA nuclease